MNIEKLSQAARAAGYAMGATEMGASDDLLTSLPRNSDHEPNAWRTGRVEPMRNTVAGYGTASWRRSVLGLFGWKATF